MICRNFQEFLDQCIEAAIACLAEHGCGIDEDIPALHQRIAAENHESKDYCVRPLSDRLMRIFQLEGSQNQALIANVCKSFMKSIFALGSVYPDVIPTLDSLRQAGYRTSIVTNTPWGSPAHLWHEEIDRLGLGSRVDLVVCCDDVGWRKPAEPIFRYTMDKLNVSAGECVFVGDDTRWDIVGPQSVGMDAILIDRSATSSSPDYPVIRSLLELLPLLQDSLLHTHGVHK